MSKITVYYFKMYYVITDVMVPSKSMATLEMIAKIGGVPLMETAKEVDTSDLDPDELYRKKK